VSKLRKRIIPVLLIKDFGVYKPTQFKNDKYIGDPLNTIRLYNTMEVDELVVLDVSHDVAMNGPNFPFVKELASQCFMPLTYGGGIKTFEQAAKLFKLGVEKISINSAIWNDIDFVHEIISIYGSQSVVFSFDIDKNWLGNYVIKHKRGTKVVAKGIEAIQGLVKDFAPGELLITAIHKEGTREGCDMDLAIRISQDIQLPIIICGGVGKNNHISELFDGTKISAVGCGTFFCTTGPYKAPLISYIDTDFIKRINNEL
jgi:cyclase